jgi:hypothetical protein
MFSDEVKPLDYVPPAGAEAPKIDLSLYSPSELLTLRSRIDSLLPPLSLGGLNLADELAVQYQTVKAMQADTIAGDEDSSKKAAAVNACLSALGAIIRMQNDLHNSERFKALETLMIRYMKRLPKDVVDRFMEDYANLIEG